MSPSASLSSSQRSPRSSKKSSASAAKLREQREQREQRELTSVQAHILSSLHTSIDHAARQFKIVLDARARELSVEFVQDITNRLVSILTILTNDSQTSMVTVVHIAKLKQLATLYSDTKIITENEARQKLVKYMTGGGAETFLPLEYFGIKTPNFSSDFGSGQVTSVSTATLVRPPLNSTMTPGWTSMSGGAAENTEFQFLDKKVFSDLLKNAQVPLNDGLSSLGLEGSRSGAPSRRHHLQFSGEAHEALKVIVNTNIAVMLGQIKTELKSYPPTNKSAPIGTKIVKQALRTTPFTIPV
jgi:hypothetical protein